MTEYFLYVSVYVSQIDIHALLDDLHTYGAIINSFGKELEDHAMTKREKKRTNNNLQTLYRKLKIEQRKDIYNSKVYT